MISISSNNTISVDIPPVLTIKNGISIAGMGSIDVSYDFSKIADENHELFLRYILSQYNFYQRQTPSIEKDKSIFGRILKFFK